MASTLRTSLSGYLATLFSILALSSDRAFAQDTCGSLITYRQFGVLLEQAPLCFRNGCGGPGGPTANSMSSACVPSSPCFPLWDLLRLEWQDNWCANCGGDIACRISGWPVLNSTAACDVSPSQWLFSGAGPCCADGSEPFQLADWVAQLCNGSQWRPPFDFYGGMAQPDWAEWIEPWNWTVRPENTTTQNFTLEGCATSYATLHAMIIDNFVSVAEAVVEMGVVWLVLVLWAESQASDGPIVRAFRAEVKTWEMYVIGGLGSGLAYILSNFATATIWSHYYAGYSHIPIGYVGLALCARPSALGFLCFLGLLSKPISRRINRLRNSLVGKTVDPFADGETLARQLLANWALNLAVGELLVQISSYYSLFATTIEGGRRGFYRVGNLIPFWRGSEAYRMYAGALVHCIAFFLSVGSLLVSTYLHARKIRAQKRIVRNKLINRIIGTLSDYYRDRENNALLNARLDAAMNKNQEILENLVSAMEGKKKKGLPRYPKLDKKWRQTKRGLGRFANWLLRHSHTVPPQHQALVQNIQPDEEPEPLTFRGRILSIWPFSSVILQLVAFTDAMRQQEALQNAKKYAQSQPPSKEAYDRILERARKLVPKEDKKHWGWLSVIFFFVSLNYTSQWLFWSGYVESSGDRWCPPDREFKLTKGLWAAISVAGFLISIMAAAIGPSQSSG